MPATSACSDLSAYCVAVILWIAIRFYCVDNMILHYTANRSCDFCLSLFYFSFLFLSVGWDWVHLVRRPLTGLLYQRRMIDDECGAVGGMRIDRGNRSTRRKPAPVPFCAPRIPHDLTWARTRTAAVGARQLTKILNANTAPRRGHATSCSWGVWGGFSSLEAVLCR
jgi:hypothetical protein